MIFKGILVCILYFLEIVRATSIPDQKTIKIEKVAEPVELGEGPHWDVKSQKLYYVDLVEGHKIIRYDPVTGHRTCVKLPGKFAEVVVPVEGTTDKLIAGVDKDVVIVTWNGETNVDDPPIKKLATVDSDRSDTRINDGKCDAAGRFWVGTMAIEVNAYITPNRGSLYKIEKNGTAINAFSPVSIGNGLTWSLDNKIMYYIDSSARQVWAFDYNLVDGTLSNKKVVFDLNNTKLAGIPDGMTNDANGNLWVALFDGKAVINIDPAKGELLQKIDLPVEKVSSVAFGGPQFEDLYVTTARYGMTSQAIRQNPDSGALYRITGLGVKGLPPHNCKYDP